MMPICEICNVFVDGDWIESKDQDDTGIRLIQTGNIGNGQYLDKGERARFINRDTFTRLKCKRVLENDILISRLPDPIGRACIIPDIGDAITGVDCTIVRLKSVCNPLYFISYTMQKQYSEQIKTYETGSTRKRISRNNLGKILIPLPPIELQNQFADFVKQVDKSKLVFREMVSKLDELVKSRFIEMFGNIDTNSSEGQTRLEYIGKFVTGGTPSSKHPEYYDGNIPWISSTALGPNYIDSSVAKYNITYEAIQNSRTVLIPPYSLMV